MIPDSICVKGWGKNAMINSGQSIFGNYYIKKC